MSGASRRHNLIVSNVITSLNIQLQDQTCEVYPNDMRVKIPDTTLYTYPDVEVVCGKPEFEDDQAEFVRQTEDRWLFMESSRLDDTLQILSIPCTLILKEVYRKVNFLSET